MKVKAVEKYYDLVLARHVLEGEEVEMTNERALELAGADNAAGRPLVTIMGEKEPPAEGSAEAEPPAAAPEEKEPSAEGSAEAEPPAAVPDEKRTSGRRRGRGTNGQKGTATGTGGQ